MAQQLGTTYTGDSGALAKRISDLTSQVTSQIQGAPAQRQQVAQEVVQNEGLLEPLAEERGALIAKLRSADTDLAAKFATPESSTYIADPMARERATSQYSSGLYGALGKTNALISSRQKILTDAIDRGMAVYEAGLKAKTLELDSLFKQLDYLERKEARAEQYGLEVMKMTGGVENELDKLLTVQEATALGVPYGTTRRMAMGKSPQKGLSPKDQLAYRNIDFIVKQIEDKAKKVAYGRFLGSGLTKVGEKFGTNVPIGRDIMVRVNDYNSYLQGNLGPIARVVLAETGPLTETDLQRARALLPKVTDDPIEVENKIMNLRNSVENTKKMMKEGLFSFDTVESEAGEYESEGDWGLGG